ncbi:centromere protein L-like isoform X2 [Physella acuta]|nr:centromere protein L-like isoform X2 [Physella acuta]
MNMTETPIGSGRENRAQRVHIHTPYSGRFHTPGRRQIYTQTPRSRRLVASTRVPEDDTTQVGFQALLKKTWKLYSLSPLYKFQHKDAMLKKYGRSLETAFVQEQSRRGDEGREKCYFSIYKGLKFQNNEPEAIHIQVFETNNKGRTVLNALLICADVDNKPADMPASFTYFPVIMVSGNSVRSTVLLHWLQSHFDCQSSPLMFSANDLRWMLACWSAQAVSAKAHPVLLQYSVPQSCEDISTISCRFDAGFCKELWERMHGLPVEREAMNEQEVNRFVESLEAHLEYTMHIVFSKLRLSEVGTSLAYISSQGKIKLFSSDGLIMVLHLICDIANEKFQEVLGTQTNNS